MRDWVPVPGSTKARLVQGALREFGARGYAPVAVHELAELAHVTTGSLYHHFGSKQGLYDAVRTDVERRVLDRMEGAITVGASIESALLVGYDYLVRSGFARLLSEPHPERADDPVAALAAAHANHDGQPVGPIMIAAWRAALEASVGGDAALVRAALLEVIGHGTEP